MSRVTTVAGVLVVLLGMAAAAAGGGRGSQTASCRLSQFTVSLGSRYSSEKTEQHTLPLRLVNHGRETCVLNGYAQVTLYDAAGAIPFVVRHGGDQMISPRAPRPVLMRRGGAVFVVLNQVTCAGRSFRVTRKITIRAPGAPASATASIGFRDPSGIPAAHRIPRYCGKGDPGSTVTVSPFVPTLRAAMRQD